MRRSPFTSVRSLRFAPFLSQIVVTRRCNIDCGYCNEYDKTSPPVATAELKRYVDRLAELRCLCVEYTGGETLLHPDIVELVRHASSHGFFERWIITNGYLLSAELIERLADAGLTNLQISVDGVTPNATTVKVLKPLRKKLELLTRARFKVQVNAVLGAGNAEEALEVARTAREMGFRPRVSVIHDGHGAMSLSPEQVRVIDEIGAAVGKRWSESNDYRRRLLADGHADFKCRAGSRYLYVDEFGLVNWCSQQRGVFTKPLLEYGWEDLRQQFFTHKDCAPTCTVGCVRSASRFDEWRKQPIPGERSRSPAINEDALIPVEALRPRAAVPAKRSQAMWRKERDPSSRSA